MLLAHGTGGASGPLDYLLPTVVAAGIGAWYLAGSRRLPVAGPARWSWSSWRWRRSAFCAGLAVVLVVLLPPVDHLADGSFVLHMAQHLVLMDVAAPLLALGVPGLPLLLALPRRWRRPVNVARALPPVRVGRLLLALPAVAVLVNALVVVAWHVPAFYDTALVSEPVHMAEHACFLLAAWLLWAPLAAPRRRLDGGTAVLYLFVSGFPMIGVGTALVMADRPLYPGQTGTGPGALAAQQTAGVLMWVPPTFLTLLLSAALVLTWLRSMERESPGDAPLPPPIPPALPVPGPSAVLTTSGEAPR